MVRLTVLVIDDERTTMRSTRTAILARGHKTFEADSLELAEFWLSRTSIDRVFVEPAMLGESGGAWLEAVHTRQPWIRSAVITRLGDEELRDT